MPPELVPVRRVPARRTHGPVAAQPPVLAVHEQDVAGTFRFLHHDPPGKVVVQPRVVEMQVSVKSVAAEMPLPVGTVGVARPGVLRLLRIAVVLGADQDRTE